MAKENKYDGTEIKILEGLEAVRKRPGMYIGTTSSSGLHHLVWEIVDNSVDEAMAGYCSKIKVTVHPDNSISVEDNGRGIPVDLHPQKKIPTLEVVLTILHAGGKFDNDSYKFSGGLHGVGVSVVNALSKKLVAQVKRDGKIYEMVFERGKTVQKMKEIGTSKTTGTIITFWPDDMIFETTTYNFDTLRDRLQETAFLNKNLKITLVDERELLLARLITSILVESLTLLSILMTRKPSYQDFLAQFILKVNLILMPLYRRWVWSRLHFSGILSSAIELSRLQMVFSLRKAECTLRASVPLLLRW